MKKKIINIIIIIIFLVGLGIFFYPIIINEINNYINIKVIDKYYENKENLNNELSNKIEDDNKNKDIDKLYEDMKAYNDKIYNDKQKDLKDPFSYEEASFDLKKIGFSENIVGYLSIPVMNLKLPIYLGANDDNMSKGAVQMSQTSLPIGGENTNCAVAAHRGWKYQAMFRDIEALSIGDEVTITNLWETLEYKVSEIKIIDPTDISEVLIQDGRDLVTLITCHPYTINNLRYLVYCERVNKDIDTEYEKSNMDLSKEQEVIKVDYLLKLENTVQKVVIIILASAVILFIGRVIYIKVKR